MVASVDCDAPEAMVKEGRGLGDVEVEADRDGVFGGGQFDFQGSDGTLWRQRGGGDPVASGAVSVACATMA